MRLFCILIGEVRFDAIRTLPAILGLIALLDPFESAPNIACKISDCVARKTKRRDNGMSDALMQWLTVLSAAGSYCLAAVVLWTNPHRPANRAFCFVLVILGTWLACIFAAILSGPLFLEGRPNYLKFWLRANAAVFGLLPIAMWLLTCAIIRRRSRAIHWQLIAVFGLSAISVLLTCLDTFVLEESKHKLARGTAYYAYGCISISLYILGLFELTRKVRSSDGIERVELQLLSINVAVTGVLIAILNVTGNFFDLRQINRASILVVCIAALFTTWIILFHRIFNARELLIRVLQALIVIIAAGGVTVTTIRLTPAWFGNAVTLIISGLITAPFTIWINKLSREWLGLSVENRVLRMRKTIIDTARTEMKSEELIVFFSRLLAAEFRSTRAIFSLRDKTYFDDQLGFQNETTAYKTLCSIGWASPESLERRRRSGGVEALHSHLAERGLGLLVCVPQRTHNPSLLVALGPKIVNWPFTYPEVCRLQAIAELMDNILTQSRLTEQAALQAKVEHLAIMSRGLAHDLKNLITPISSFLVHTQGKFIPNSTEEEVHGAARRAVRIMTEYVREAMFFSERLAPRVERVDLKDVCESSAQSMQSRAAARGIVLNVYTSQVPAINADRVLLQRLIGNLVANAVDASAPGQSVTVCLEPANNGQLEVHVADQGIGIAPDHLNRIFEPYFTTKEFGDDVRGFGLGLTIAQKIAHLHGGNITATSTIGQGTSMIVRLPTSNALRSIETPRPQGAIA